MSDFVDVVEVEVGTVEVVEVLVPAASTVPGPTGEGVPEGGTDGQVLAKASATDFDTEWVDQTGGGGAVDSVNTQTGDVVLDAGDVGADPAGTAAAAVATHAGLADPHPGYLTPAEGNAAYDPAGAATGAVAAHEADTTNVHGIADTGNLVYTDDVRLSDDRDPTAHAASHQDGGSDELALDGSQITSGTVADARIAATIARDTEVATAVSDHAAATDPHGDRAYTDTKVSTHEADTSNVHGIPDTSALVVTSDARLSDARTPTAHAASHVTGGGDTIASAVASGNAGLMSGADKAKLDGVESGATADQSAAELLTAIKTVDGAGSGLDADLLDGVENSALLHTTGDETASGIKAFSTQVLVNESSAVLASAKLDLSGAIHVKPGVIGLAYIATGVSGARSALDTRSTQGTGLDGSGNPTGSNAHSLSGDVLGAWHVGGSHDAAWADCAVIECVATENFSAGTSTASGTRWNFSVTANTTETKFNSFRLDQDFSAQVYGALTVGNLTTPVASSFLNVYAIGSALTDIKLMHAGGTRSSPTASALNSRIGLITMEGYETTTPAFGPGGVQLLAFAAEAWTDSAQGCNLSMYTTPIGSTTKTETARYRHDGTFLCTGPIAPKTAVGTAPLAGSGIDLGSGLICTRKSTVSLSNGANANVTLPTSSFVTVTGPSAGFSISGFASPVNGAMFMLVNLTGQAMTITHEATSTAANRITSLTGADIVTTGNGAVMFWYDSGTSRWIATAATL